MKSRSTTFALLVTGMALALPQAANASLTGKCEGCADTQAPAGVSAAFVPKAVETPAASAAPVDQDLLNLAPDTTKGPADQANGSV
jgi:hypothetical protein